MMMKKLEKKLFHHMKHRRRELKKLLAEKNITGKMAGEFILKYTQMDDSCSYEGTVPLPENFSNMPAETFKLLDACGAVRASLNSWAIAAWSQNANVQTMENLQKTMDCVSILPLVPDTYNNFSTLVTACSSDAPTTFSGRSNYTSQYFPEYFSVYNGSLPEGVYGSPYGIHGLSPLISGPSGWRPNNYFNFSNTQKHQGSEIVDGTEVLMSAANGNYYSAGLLSGYELPRLGVGPYMSTAEVNAQVLPKFEPSQWVVNDGPMRPWQPSYPIMTIPPTPIPLLGTSNV